MNNKERMNKFISELFNLIGKYSITISPKSSKDGTWLEFLDVKSNYNNVSTISKKICPICFGEKWIEYEEEWYKCKICAGTGLINF